MRSIVRFPCGRWTKWAVLAAWLVVFVVAGPLAGKLTGIEKNDPADALPKDAESTRVVDLAKQFTPSDTVPALVVYERGGAASAADRAKVDGDVRRFAGIDNVGGRVVGPIPAKDGAAFQVVVPIRAGDKGSEAIVSAVEQIRAIARDGDGTTGLRVYVTGPAGYEAAFGDVFEGIDSSLLYITAAIVIVILLLTYRSPVLWLLPLVCVIVALTAAQAVIYLLAGHAGLVVNDLSATTLTVLVFGAGTDYALLLIARYREELRRHADRHEAMAEALHRAGPAIIASASTVALSLLCFLVAELSSSKSVGPVTAIGIALGLGVMLTLLPALLVVFGRWMFWPVRPTLGSPEPTGRGVWARIGAGVARRPRLVWLVTAVVLGAVAFGMTGLRTNDLQLKDSFRTRPEAVTGEQALVRHFPAGTGNPVQVIGRAAAAPQLRAALAATPGVTAVSAPVTRDGFSYLEGTLTSSPDSQASFATVDRLRSRVHVIPGADGLVGGSSAVNLDTQRAARHDRNLVIPLVLVVVFVILAVLLRALVAPLLLVGTVVLSFAAALGVSTLVFDHIFHFAGSFPAFPLYAFVFLVALGVDYNIFLMTRVHEESRRHGTRRGALIGLAATGGVITSAGLVLAGTFMALGSLPVVLAAEMGFVVAFGVLLDTFVVRSVLVTALVLDVGRWCWWPTGLAAGRASTSTSSSTTGRRRLSPDAMAADPTTERGDGRMPARSLEAQARELFAPLGPTYDRVGAALSLGQDPRWRRFLVSRLPRGGQVLDVATGTGLVAAELLRQGFGVTGVDQSPEMLAVAHRRFGDEVQLITASAEALPLDSGSVDHLTFTYLLRYVADPGATLAELARVVRPGGVVASLEFGVPQGPARPLWDLYVQAVLPIAGRLLRNGWREVGDFLGGSIRDFWQRHPLQRQLEWWHAAGLRGVEARPRSLGAAVVIWGRKP